MLVAAMIGIVLAASPGTPISGTVVAEDGSPIVGAELVLTNPEPGESPVASRGRSGEGGRFRFDRPADLAPKNPYLIPTLWTVAPGYHASILRFAKAVPGPDEPVRVVLRPAARSEFRVESPDGKPLAGARIRVQLVQPEPMPLPDPVSELIGKTTGPDGLAVLDAFAPEEIFAVDVIAPGLGIQPRRFDREKPGPRRIRLLPVSSLSGRVVPDPGIDPKLAEGWKIRVWTNVDTGDPLKYQTAGYGDATTDAEGRFRIPELAPGIANISVIPPKEDLDVQAQVGPLREVPAGREGMVEIRLRPTSVVTGLVRERGTGNPVAGVRVNVSRLNASGQADAVTDAQGRYTARGMPGLTRVSVVQAPPSHVMGPGQNWVDVTVPDPPARLDVKPFEVARAGPPLAGEVRDEAGRPVAGAEVRAEWSASIGDSGVGGVTGAKTDDAGRFAISPLPPGARATLTARAKDRATEAPVPAVAGDAPAKLRLVPKATVALSGRVLGRDGRPIDGADVSLNRREAPDPRPGVIRGQQMEFQVVRVFTAADGTFAFPKDQDREGREYQVEVRVPGFHLGKSPWVTPGDGDVVTLPDVALRREVSIRTVSGRLVDLRGRPIAGARVLQAGDGPRWTSATSDDAGKFRLPGVYDGPALVFAEKDGFRFGGAVVGAGDDAAEVRLTPEGEPPPKRLATLPSPMPRDRERALAREWLAAVPPENGPAQSGSPNARVIPALARLDPAKVLEMLEDRVIGQSSAALQAVAIGYLETDPREAVATIERDSDPATRAAGFLALADAAPTDQPGLRDEMIDRTLVEARRLPASEAKLKLLRTVADRLLVVGQIDRARGVVREGQAVLAALPRDRYSYEIESFGEVLAILDLKAARDLFERKGVERTSAPDEGTIRRHLGEAAVRLAAVDPEEAERLISQASGGPNVGDRENLVFRVARNMARADLPRARRLMLTTGAPGDPNHPITARPALPFYGLGLLANERADTDPAGARALLDEAYAGLLKTARAAEGGTGPPPSTLMGALLPTVERVDPDRLPERLWMAASCRPARPQEPDFALVNMAEMALLTSRYDRAMADAIASPVLERIPAVLEAAAAGNGYVDNRIYDILAAYDPASIVNLLKALPPSARKTTRNRDGYVSVSAETALRVAGAEMLARPIAERRRDGLAKSSILYGMLPGRP